MPDVDITIRARRSARASFERRERARRSRRRALRSRTTVVAAVAGLTLTAGGALAAPVATPTRTEASAPSAIAAAQRALGIPADGIAGPQTRAAVKRFQRAKGLVVDGVLGPKTFAALGVSRTPRRSPTAAAEAAERMSVPAVLEAIALCESGGDPTAVSQTGRYRGKYQFSRATWRAMGGQGDPAAAPEAEQDRRALALFRQQGTAPWPACSRKVAP